MGSWQHHCHLSADRGRCREQRQLSRDRVEPKQRDAAASPASNADP